MTEDFAKLLRCPIDGQPLVLSEDGLYLENRAGGRRYPISGGIAMLIGEQAENRPEACPADTLQ